MSSAVGAGARWAAARWSMMAERDGGGMGDVLQFLNRAVLRRSLR
jgi:hypothetical protein